MEIVAQRPTLLHQALTTQPAPVKAEAEQVQTELSGAQAVTATSESGENQNASERTHASDSRIGALPEKSSAEDTEVVRGYNYDDESEELIFSLTQQPEGDVIYELPSKTARQISAFIDQILQLQEKRSLGGEEKAADANAYLGNQVGSDQAQQEHAA